MAKTAKTPTRKPAQRSSQSGQFLGRTKEGLPIPRPDFRPNSFTLRELDKAVRAAKRRQAETQAG